MWRIFATTAFIAITLSACTLKNFGLNHDIVAESKDHSFQVSQTNPAWIGEDLKERASPAKSAICTDLDNLIVAVHYSAPLVKGRTIWGNLVPYNEIWRTGANEATMIELSNKAIINGQSIESGRYALFTIPTETNWTVIINRVFDQWGAFQYDKHKKQDVLRFEVTPTTCDMAEMLNFSFQKNSTKQVMLNMKWENVMLPIAIEAAN